VRRYDAYLIRHWSLDGTERVEVMHIGSGVRALLTSLPRAVAWIRAHADDAATERDPPAAEGDAAAGKPGSDDAGGR
jgi:hypothetical protein